MIKSKNITVLIGKPRSGKTIKCIEMLRDEINSKTIIFDPHDEYTDIHNDEVIFDMSVVELDAVESAMDAKKHIRFVSSIDEASWCNLDHTRCINIVFYILKEWDTQEKYCVVIDNCYLFQLLNIHDNGLFDYVTDVNKDNIYLIVIEQVISLIDKRILKRASVYVDFSSAHRKGGTN